MRRAALLALVSALVLVCALLVAGAAQAATTKPSIPTGLTIAPGDRSAKLTWNANPSSEDVDSYQVYRGTTTGWIPLIKDGLTSPSFTDSGLTNGTTYYYRVSAHNNVGYGDWTAPVAVTPKASTVTTKPSIPTGFTATAGDGKVALKWNANPSVEQVDRYQVYRNDQFLNLNVFGTSYTDSSVTNGTTYIYRVSAHNAVGYGDWTAPLSATPTAAISPPPSPSGFGFARIAINGSQNTSFTTSALRDKLIVYQGLWQTGQYDQAEAANPGVISCVYENLSRASAFNPPNSAISLAEARSNSYGVNWDSGVADSDAGGNIIRPVEAAKYAEFASRRVLEKIAASGRPWECVFFDDVNSSHDGTGGASVWDPWMEAVLKDVAARMKAAGKIPVANISGTVGQWNLQDGGWEARQFDSGIAYGLDEHCLLWPGGGAQSLSYVREAARVMRLKGSHYWCQTHSPSSGAADWGLATTLVMTGSLFDAQMDYSTELWFTSFDRAKRLGAPLEAPRQVGTDIWERRFEGGTVRTDLANRIGSIP